MAYTPASTSTTGTGVSSTGSDYVDPLGGFAVTTNYVPEITQKRNALYGGTDTGDVKGTDSENQRGIAKAGPDKIKDLQTKLKAAGYDVDVNGVWDNNSVKAYQDLEESASFNQKNGVKVTPDALLDSLVAARAKTAAAPTTTTKTTTAVNLTNPATARATLESAMADKLGRKPTSQEIAAFTGALNQYQQTNPETTTESETDTPDAAGNTSAIDNSTGDDQVSPADFASSYVEDNHGPEQQAINHLSWYNVAMNALGSSGISTGLPT